MALDLAALPYLYKAGEERPVMGHDRVQLMDGLHGKHYNVNRHGRMFVAASATAGIALIVAATTGNHPTLWNPPDSGKTVNIKKLLLGYVSGNNAPGSLAWNVVKNTGAFNAANATGSAILTFTHVDLESARAGGPANFKTKWAPATNTYTAAPAYYRPIGLSLFTGVAATAVAPFPLFEDYDGDLQIAPGTALCLVSQQATTTSLFRIAIIGEEVDE